MKISTSWAQELSSTDITSVGADVIVQKIGAQLGAVEEVIDWGKRYDGAVIARVITCIKHPNADKLSLCTIDDGGVVQSVERDESGYVQVVCGAPNVREGLMVAWIPPGATVPSTFSDTEPFVLGARELRGVISNGMLASPSELSISDSHDGILELTEEIAGIPLVVGMSFKQLFGLDDTVIDLENKMFTHRPDCFGILGIARELAGIQHIAFKSPDWYVDAPVFTSANKLSLQAKVSTQNVPRLMVVAMDGVTVKPSPILMQSQLSRVGIRPINNIVDITNWLMHVTGQPLHAYDYNKVLARSGGSRAMITARQSQKDDTFTLLSGKQFTATDDQAVLICADDAPIGLGGVMGGSDTEVDENTTAIIIECANFDMYSIRKTAMKYGLFTDAVTRFNKGQSPIQNDRVLAKAIQMVSELSGGVQASDVCDITPTPIEPMPSITVSAEFINERLGSSLVASDMAILLNNVECKTLINNDSITVTVPFWRRDLSIAEDIVEEVGRLHGFDSLPVRLPMQQGNVTKKDALLTFKAKLRDILSNAGANELLTYSFVHGKQFEAVGQNTEHAFRLSNALSPELQYYRLSLTPNVLEKVHPNIKEGYGECALFEIGKAHTKQWIGDDNLPIEAERLALVFAADIKSAKNYQGAAFYQAKAYANVLFAKLGIHVKYVPLKDASPKIVTSEPVKPFLAHRSAIITDESGEFIGVIGEYTATVIKNLKLSAFCAGFEIDIEQLRSKNTSTKQEYIPLSKFPSTTQDISFKVNTTVTYADTLIALKNALHKHTTNAVKIFIEPLDIYNKENTRHFAFRLTITSYEKTLQTSDVNLILTNTATEVETAIGAVRI